ncbi:MAG: hypothetical protein GY777_21110 [Candidatus Brocadiaceae bacterium]|nr:hypothetical protein [Candidatus Brocadiaceae bacterium]
MNEFENEIQNELLAEDPCGCNEYVDFEALPNAESLEVEFGAALEEVSAEEEFELAALEALPGAESLEAELDAALEEVSAEEEFGLTALEALSDPESLAVELDAALEEVSAEEEFEFAELEDAEKNSLDDIIAIAANRPGLKITFSF